MLMWNPIKPRNRLILFLGTGRGIDHIGIAVRDLQEAENDYEQVLGFKCIKNSPVYKVFYGQSIMIPPDLTHGVLMEMFQR